MDNLDKFEPVEGALVEMIPLMRTNKQEASGRFSFSNPPFELLDDDLSEKLFKHFKEVKAGLIEVSASGEQQLNKDLVMKIAKLYYFLLHLQTTDLLSDFYRGKGFSGYVERAVKAVANFVAFTEINFDQLKQYLQDTAANINSSLPGFAETINEYAEVAKQDDAAYHLWDGPPKSFTKYNHNQEEQEPDDFIQLMYLMEAYYNGRVDFRRETGVGIQTNNVKANDQIPKRTPQDSETEAKQKEFIKFSKLLHRLRKLKKQAEKDEADDSTMAMISSAYIDKLISSIEKAYEEQDYVEFSRLVMQIETPISYFDEGFIELGEFLEAMQIDLDKCNDVISRVADEIEAQHRSYHLAKIKLLFQAYKEFAEHGIDSEQILRAIITELNNLILDMEFGLRQETRPLIEKVGNVFQVILKKGEAEQLIEKGQVIAMYGYDPHDDM